MFKFHNDFKCLSHVVLQSCIRQYLTSTFGILQLVQEMLQSADVKAVAYIELLEWPQKQGVVDCQLCVGFDDGVHMHREFKVSDLAAVPAARLLYDRRRDGEVEYLRLVH